MEIFNEINKLIREQHGMRAKSPSSKLIDSELDSFGHTMLFMELDAKYGYFEGIPEDEDVFAKVEWETITVQDIINKIEGR